MPVKGVAIRYVRGLLSTEFARERRASLLKSAGIEPEVLVDATCRVSLEQYDRLLQAIWDATRDESLGFAPRPMKPGTFALMCQTLLTCDQLEHALRRMTKFYGLITDDFYFEIHEHEAGLTLELHIRKGLRGPENFFTEAVFTLFLRLSAWLIDQSINPVQINFRYPQAESSYSFEGKLTCPVRYQRSVSSLEFPSRSLQETIKRSSRELKALLAQGPQYFLVDFRQQDRYSERLKTYWKQRGELLNTSLDTFAKIFGMSASSLRRKLREEGINFHDLREHVRKQQSLHYLLHTHKSLEVIAALMGYSEPSTFHRAFKKWTGITPRDFRQKRQKAEQSEHLASTAD